MSLTPLPGLSERNLTWLEVLVPSAHHHSRNPDESWFNILEVLENADYVLTSKGGRSTTSISRRGSGGVSGSVSSTTPPTATSSLPSGTHHPLLTELDPDNVWTTIQRLLDTPEDLEDGAIRYFLNLLLSQFIV